MSSDFGFVPTNNFKRAIIKYSLSLAVVFTHTNEFIIETFRNNRDYISRYSTQREDSALAGSKNKIYHGNNPRKSHESNSTLNGDNFRGFLQHQHGDYNYLLQLKTGGQWISRSIVAIFIYFFLNHAIQSLLDSIDILSDYKFIDCYLVGHLSLDGRFSFASRYLTTTFCFYQLCRMLVHLSSPKLYDLATVDFVLSDPKDIKLWQEIFSQHSSESLQLIENFFNKDYFFKLTQNNCPRSLGLGGDLLESSQMLDSRRSWSLASMISSSSSSAKSSGSISDIIVLRPNRNVKTKKALDGFTMRFYLFYVWVVIAMSPILFIILFPMIYTERGFELNYALCVEYLHRSAPSEWLKFDHIYSMTPEKQWKFQNNITYVRSLKTEPVILPLRNFRFYVNLFRFFQTQFDAICNSIYWSVTFHAFTHNLYYSFIITLDAMNYLNFTGAYLQDLHNRLVKLLLTSKVAESAPTTTAQILDKSRTCNRRATGTICCDPNSYQPLSLELHIRLAQALATDSFSFVRRANKYISFFAICWLSYCLLIELIAMLIAMEISHFGIDGGSEVVTIQISVMLYCLLSMSLMAEVHRKGLGIYKVVTSIMALQHRFKQRFEGKANEINLETTRFDERKYPPRHWTGPVFSQHEYLLSSNRQKTKTSSSRFSQNLANKSTGDPKGDGLHPFEATAVAVVDDELPLTDKGWTMVLDYFSPIPLYCFSLFQGNEISWLLLCKVSFLSLCPSRFPSFMSFSDKKNRN